MKRHEPGTARVIPVILRHCDWHGTPIGQLQALPKDGKPVVGWPDRDQAFADVARGIRAVVEEIADLRANAESDGASPNSTSRWLFQILAGKWRLTYGPRDRTEICEIDTEGYYYVENHANPYCVLKHVSFEPSTRKIHWLKARAPGARSGQPQEESLILSDDCQSMNGHADHDGHRLNYQRLS
jgi:hypothetical protein